MTTRQMRRAAERKAQKEARREGPPAPATVQPEAPGRSTGPRTEAGKATSSRNSFKHGLYSHAICIPGENPADLDTLKASLIQEHQPGTETEALLVNEIAEQYWRQCRARRMEAQLLSEDELNLRHLAAAQRLMSSAERGFHKALKTLRELQKARGVVPQKLEPSPEFVPQSASCDVEETDPELNGEYESRLQAIHEYMNRPLPTSFGCRATEEPTS